MKQNWTEKNIPDLTGKIIIVTGGNCGLGYEAVKAFAAHGAEVIMACRSTERGDAAKQEIMRSYPSGTIHVRRLDLADLESVRKFCSDFLAIYSKLDILLNNAGIMERSYHQTADGFEDQFGTNYLGHFALTGLLWDHISHTDGARIVNVSSLAHRSGSMDFEHLIFEDGKGYSPMRAYGRSKLAKLLFTYELQRRIEHKELPIKAVAAHPGVSRTRIDRHIERPLIKKFFQSVLSLKLQPASKGSLPEIRAAVDLEVKGGEYYGPAGNHELKGPPVIVSSSNASHNIDDAKRLWAVSEELTGVSFLPE